MLKMNNQTKEQNKKNAQGVEKKRRRVTFAFDDENNDDDETNTQKCHKGAAPLLSTLTPEVCRDVWYQPDEISALKKRTRDLVFYGSTELGDDMSGLERYCMERSKYKRQVLQYVLRMQKEQKGADFLRTAARKCTGWARDLALHEGFIAFCDVYDPLACLLGGDCLDENFDDRLFRDDNKRKTAVETPQTSGDRRVRQRTTLAN
jgi:hypothetical protein